MMSTRPLFATLLCLALTTPLAAFAEEEDHTPHIASTPLTQHVKLDWSKAKDIIIKTTFNKITTKEAACNNECREITLSTPAQFSDGSMELSINDPMHQTCTIQYSIPFIIKYDYLVTRMRTYEFPWKSNDGKPCNQTKLVLAVHGDPTEPEGYTFTFVNPIAKPSKSH